MAIDVSDIKFYRSATITDTDNNGGGINLAAEVIDNIKYNLFPRVSHADRVNGITRYRKLYMANRNSLNEQAYGGHIGLLTQSNGGDRFYLTGDYMHQMNLDDNTLWSGAGVLAAPAAAGATSIQLLMEANDYAFWPAQLLYITDGTNEAWVTVLDAGRQEVIGTGNGTNLVFNKTLAYPPIWDTVNIQYTINNMWYDAYCNAQGNITGDHISSGTINMQTGELSITFDAPPDNITDITIDYNEQIYSYVGNVATVRLATPIPQDYAALTTNVAACVSVGDLYAQVYLLDKQSAAGNIDINQITVSNIGTVTDTWTLQFYSATGFYCNGLTTGQCPNGLITASYSPTNSADGGAPYFVIPPAAWSGVWQAGDVVRFQTVGSYRGVWLKEVVPAGTAREPNNVVNLVWFIE